MGAAGLSWKRAAQFEAFLRKREEKAGEEWIKACLEAVGDDGALTCLIRKAGQLPEGAYDLLTLTGVRKVKAIGDWWYSGGAAPGLETTMAAWLSWNKIDPGWMAARSGYAAYLRQKGKDSGSYIDNHLSAVEEGRTLTRLVQEAGLLPEDVPSLLLLNDRNAINAIAAWAKSAPACLDRGWATYLQHWLEWKGCTFAPVERSSHAEILRRPPHGIRLLTLMQTYRKVRRLTAETAVDELLPALSGGYAGADSVYHENRAAFHALHTAACNWLDEQPDAAKAALLRVIHGQELADLCIETVTDILGGSHWQLIDFLKESGVTYENSLLPELIALYDAGRRTGTCDGARADCWLKLARVVLRDCVGDAFVERTDVPKGIALRDTRLRNSALTAFLLPPPWPQFCELLVAAGEAVGEEAARLNRASSEFLDAHWDALVDSLPEPCPPWSPVSAEQLRGDAKSCVLAIRLWVERAELLIRWPWESDTLECLSPEMSAALSEIDQTKIGVRLMEAHKCVETAMALLDAQIDQAQVVAELCTGRGGVYGLQFRAFLCGAEITYQLALLEVEEDRLDDAVGLYFARCRADLIGAKNALPRLALTEKESYHDCRTRWGEICKSCFNCFFSEGSPLVQRLVLPQGGGAQEAYQAECNAWQQTFGSAVLGLTAPAHAPKIIVPMDMEPEPGDEVLFPAVFSSVFDSVSGQDWQHQQAEAEDAVFRLVTSEKTCLLQMNQVVDNLTFLKMLDLEAFRWMCRKSMVSLSCYTFQGVAINSPYIYLMQCLDNPGFHFSSCSAFNRGEEGWQVCRGAMKRYLQTGFGADEFPSERREELLFLAECYRVLFESFQPSDLRRNHQDSAYRYPPREIKKTVLSLAETVRYRAERLIEEAKAGRGQELDIVGPFGEYALRWSGINNRSAYDAAIDEASGIASPTEKIRLQKFRKLVHQCYFISNGLRCCPTVQLTENDPDLILTEERDEAMESLGAPEYIIRQRRRPDTKYQFDWHTICEQAVIVRQCRRMDRTATVEQQAALLGSRLGCNFGCSGGDLYLSDFSTRTSNGRITHYSPADAGDRNKEVLEFHHPS